MTRAHAYTSCLRNADDLLWRGRCRCGHETLGRFEKQQAQSEIVAHVARNNEAQRVGAGAGPTDTAAPSTADNGGLGRVGGVTS